MVGEWPPIDPEMLVRVTVVLCTRCLAGEGGECHTPGCALWMNRAPDVPIADNCEMFVPLAVGHSEGSSSATGSRPGARG